MERMCVSVGIYCMYALVCVCVCVCVCLEVEVGGHRNATEASPSSCASRCASPTAPVGAPRATEPPKLCRKAERGFACAWPRLVRGR